MLEKQRRGGQGTPLRREDPGLAMPRTGCRGNSKDEGFRGRNERGVGEGQQVCVGGGCPVRPWEKGR